MTKLYHSTNNFLLYNYRKLEEMASAKNRKMFVTNLYFDMNCSFLNYDGSNITIPDIREKIPFVWKSGHMLDDSVQSLHFLFKSRQLNV